MRFCVGVEPKNGRSSRLEVFCRKGVLRNTAKFTGKHLCQSLFFNTFAYLRSATSLKKRLCRRVFSCEFCKLSRNNFFYRTPPVAASKMELNSILQSFPKLGICKNQIYKLQNICGNLPRYRQTSQRVDCYSLENKFFLQI